MAAIFFNFDLLNNAGWRSALTGIAEGDRFIMGWTVSSNSEPSIGFTTASSIVEGGSATTITGTVQDAEDDNGDVTVTAATSLGTVSTPVNTDGTWSLTLTAPAVQPAQQNMDVTVTAEDTGGLTATASRSWMVRANQQPTVMITTAGGAQQPNAAISLAAVATAPEAGQSLTHLWEVTAGTGTLINETTLNNAVLTLGGLTVAAQTITARITVTDPHSLTATDTVQFTIRAALPPMAPDMPTVTPLNAVSVSVAFVDPSSDLAITQRDVRYRTGGGAWTELTSQTFPLQIDGLTQGTQYEFETQAHSAAGASGWGDDATATTLGPTELVAAPSPTATLSVLANVTKSRLYKDIQAAPSASAAVTASASLSKCLRARSSCSYPGRCQPSLLRPHRCLRWL